MATRVQREGASPTGEALSACSECGARPVQARGLCQRCYDAKRTGQRLRVNTTAPCSNGDGRPQHSKGLCQACYRRDRRREIDPAVGTRKPGPAPTAQPKTSVRKLATDTHCANGHELTEKNIYRQPGQDAPKCRICIRNAQQRYHGRTEGGDAPVGPRNAEKTHCPWGHEYTPENTYYSDGGKVRHCRICSRESRLMRTYGLERGEYDRRFAEQGGKCAICRSALEEGKNLHVDHDHVDGSVRGLLCTSCNQGLGRFDDDEDRLLRAATYVRSHRERTTSEYQSLGGSREGRGLCAGARCAGVPVAIARCACVPPCSWGPMTNLCGNHVVSHRRDHRVGASSHA